MANVTPGYSFTSATDPITFAKLNLLAQPTVTIGSGEVVTANLNSAITITQLTLGGPAFCTDIQSLSGAGAVDVTHLITEVTTTGANALTLADGTNGQFKIIRMIVDAGDGTLTPTTKTGYTTITFNDVGDTVVLQFRTTAGWYVLSNYGCTIA
jgi:hypothetical protein